MKIYKICVFLFGIAIAIGLNWVFADNVTLPLLGKVIYIDPGHGGLDPGTVYQDIYEKNINLNISLALKKELEEKGATVYMTRDGDYDLSRPNATFRKKSDFDNRISLINNTKPDLYLSIHQNYLKDVSYFGPQVFYTPSNIKFASIMQKALNDELKDTRKIKQMPDIYMYEKLKSPGLLIECGFLSNAADRKKLTDKKHQELIAKAITNGVLLYFT